jgi:hypothetical protein
MSKTSELLKQDLSAIGLTQKDFADMLTKLCETPISQPAVSLWCHRDYVPPKRRWAVAQVLGEGSQLVRYMEQQSDIMTAARMPPPFARKIMGEQPIDTSAERFELRREPAFIRIERAFDMIVPGAHPERRLDLGPYKRSFDYVSSTTVASIIEATMGPRQPYHPFTIGRRVLNLALARKMYPSRDCILLLVGDDESSQIAEVRFDCNAFDVELMVFRDLESAVIFLTERDHLESLPPLDPDE